MAATITRARVSYDPAHEWAVAFDVINDDDGDITITEACGEDDTGVLISRAQAADLRDVLTEMLK